MRVTNNMITGNTKTNINSNKVLVDKYNTQMTTQKKIKMQCRTINLHLEKIIDRRNNEK